MQYQNIGKYIKEKRIKTGISLNQFALQNEIEPAILSRIENQKQDIKLNVLIKIANGFKLQPSEFLQSFEQHFKK